MIDVTPEAEALARVMWPKFDAETYPSTWIGMVQQAQRAIDAGWTPPPDPHAEIAQELMTAIFPGGFNWPAAEGEYAHSLLAAVRRMDLRRADQ